VQVWRKHHWRTRTWNQVNLDATKMQGYGLSIPQVQQIILSSNLIFQQEIFKRENKKCWFV
jgi:multidrug efflux pump subunit AcrB